MAATDALDQEIARYMKAGFIVAYRGDGIAQLTKKKQFSLVWFFIGFGILYLPYYVAKRDKSVTLEMGDDGKIRRKGDRAEQAWLLEQLRRNR